MTLALALIGTISTILSMIYLHAGIVAARPRRSIVMAVATVPLSITLLLAWLAILRLWSLA